MIGRMLRLAATVSILACAASALAADLKSIERKIAKEPAYAGKPKYCLLVFGPEARTRIWLALDGDKLYVDKNGNGDLTDDGPPIAAKVDGEFQNFRVSELRDGSRLHKDLYVSTFPMKLLAASNQDARRFVTELPDSLGFRIGVSLEMPGRIGAAANGRVNQLTYPSDVRGLFQFSESPRGAPVIHFGGPWSILLTDTDELTIGREREFFAALGTLGIGAGSTAFVEYEKLIPSDLHPTVEIDLPAKAPGEGPVRQRYELRERC